MIKKQKWNFFEETINKIVKTELIPRFKTFMKWLLVSDFSKFLRRIGSGDSSRQWQFFQHI